MQPHGLIVLCASCAFVLYFFLSLGAGAAGAFLFPRATSSAFVCGGDELSKGVVIRARCLGAWLGMHDGHA